MAAPTERLPWLHDDPPAKATAVAQPSKVGSMWPWYLLLLLLVAAVAAGAWWLSTGKEAAPPQLPAEESLPIPVTEAPPAEQPLVPEQPGDEAESVAAAPQQPARTPAARPNARPVQRGSAGAATTVAAEDEGTRPRSIFPADDALPAPPAAGPNPVVVYNPRPYGGRVVQLGAFPTRKQAEDEWKRVTRRYPYLTTKPKMVNTVDVRGLGGGRPTRMYRLQLGTSSQAQSVVICQQLERAGHSCVVVY